MPAMESELIDPTADEVFNAWHLLVQLSLVSIKLTVPVDIGRLSSVIHAFVLRRFTSRLSFISLVS